MSLQSLISQLSSLTSLSPAFIEELKSGLEEEHYTARQILHGAGQVENRLWYLSNGLGRSYIYDNDNRQHTLRFWQPGDIIFSYAGLLKQASHEYIDLLVDSELYAFAYEKLDQLMKNYPETALLSGHINRRYLQSEHNRNYLHSLHTKDRYRSFRKEHAMIFQKVPLGIIASYLHMTRENLSRIISSE